MTALAGWVDRAACKEGQDPRRWDTIKANNATTITDDVDRARATCLDCPVMMECLIHSIVFDKKDQVWGGMTDEERDAWAEREGLVPA
jgi:enoyl-[acyl-carrier-protein] reductase (NADH)